MLRLVCKLNPTLDTLHKLETTLQVFADACNYTHETVKSTLTNSVSIQTLIYQTLRKQFGLSANLAVRVCARVATARKTAKQREKMVKAFQPTSVDYDARIFTFRERDWSVSLTLIDGRYHIPLELSNYQRGKLKGQKPSSAILYKHQNSHFYIHIFIQDIDKCS